MPRVDDYAAAFDIAAELLKSKDPALVAAASGAILGDGAFEVEFVGQQCLVSLDPVIVTGPSGEEPPLTDQVLILHYLSQATGRELTREWIAYREVPGAEVYHAVFYKRAVKPFLSAFGPRPELLVELAAPLMINLGDTGDASVVVRAFPRVPLMLILWRGDDEFPAEASILFDKSISGYLSAEDIVWLAGRVVYPLAGQAGARGGEA